ncbi:hypothetical protein GmHk_19G054142 [Glycine max]|nr:hypothetical protein GmHk_19G054142 [Glycine max]
MQSSQRDVYLGAYLNGAIKGLDDAPQPKSKASARWIVVKCNRQKGSTECGYYVMHWMSTIIIGTFRNNWEAYFNDPRPLEPERSGLGFRDIIFCFNLLWFNIFYIFYIMGSPPASTPRPLPPPPSDASDSLSASEADTQSLTSTIRPVVHVDPATGKADGPHRKKLRSYLGIVARDKVDVTYENWKEVPTAQKDLIWEDIQEEFDIPEASDSRTKRKLLQTVGERWRQFKSDHTRKWAHAADQDGVEDTVCEKYGISKEKWAQFCQTRCAQEGTGHQKQNTTPHVLSRGGYDYLEQKLLAEKTKKKLEEAA